MAKLGKASRDKSRWVGLRLDQPVNQRSELESLISQIESIGGNFRLYDFVDNKAIISMSLDTYYSSRVDLEQGVGGMKSITSSGKIKLVRERLGIVVKRRKR